MEGLEAEFFCQQKSVKGQLEKHDSCNFLSCGWIGLIEHPDGAVIAAGFHGVVESVGFLDCTDKESRSQGAEGFQGGPVILIAQAGILGSAQVGRNLQQHKDITVNQKHQLNDNARTAHNPQYI